MVTFYKVVGTYTIGEDDKVYVLKENGGIMAIYDTYDEFESYINLKQYKLNDNYILEDYYI